jgi:branched-chain amino acid transport system ATP-binding protein
MMMQNKNSPGSKPILMGEKVTKRFGGLTAVSEVDFVVREGEILGLIGPNGSGKTTLINTISGFYQPDEGNIIFNGEAISRMKPFEIAKLGIGRTFQFVRPFEEMSVIDNITLGILYGTNQKSIATANQKAMEILDFLDLTGKKDVLAGDLIMAERKRLEIGRALSINPKLILLDEVFAGLNEGEVESGIDIVNRISKKLNITILMIEHVLSVVMKTCNRLMVLNYGKKIGDGECREIMDNPQVIEAYLGAANAKCQ